MLKKAYLISVLVLVCSVGYLLTSDLRGLRAVSPPDMPTAQKVSVVASFFPLADFAKNVGGDLVTVTTITPAGAEPHDYEPTPQDIAKMYSADIFLFNGNGVDAWADKVFEELKAKGIVVIRIADHLEAFKNDHKNSEGEIYDPHFWLDPLNAKKESELIASALITIDSAHEKEYTQRRDAFGKQLIDLDETFTRALASCQIRQIVTSHNAFHYLAKRYHLETLYILGLSPDQEPSSKTIADVVDIAKEKHVSTIFFETLVNPKLAQTIADEIGAKTLVLNPLEGLTDEELRSGKNYISIMKENLVNLRTALVCQ